MFINNPSFSKYIEVDETYQRMLNIWLPIDQEWEKLTDLL